MTTSSLTYWSWISGSLAVTSAMARAKSPEARSSAIASRTDSGMSQRYLGRVNSNATTTNADGR